VGLIKESDFEFHEEPVPALAEGQLVVRNIYLSLDPANRGWVTDLPSYVPPVPLGEVMRGIAIGVVEDSRHPGFQPGDMVQGMLGWQSYLLSDGGGLQRLPRDTGLPLTASLGLFSHIGLTAYFGLLQIGKPRAGETLVVSAAAGAVGSLVGQIGKLKGCRVVGITGSEEKCRWITDDLGFDHAINYKAEPVVEKLQECCVEGIDVYFDNVGGEILDAVLGRINKHARLVICGLISQYNAEEPVPGPFNFANILVRSARVEGFIVLDFLDRAGAALKDLGQWLAEGKLQYRVDIVEGLENAPSALNKLFDGSNRGKLIVQVSEEP
jgi:NADPH-dependent curcumin reductase CurA